MARRRVSCPSRPRPERRPLPRDRHDHRRPHLLGRLRASNPTSRGHRRRPAPSEPRQRAVVLTADNYDDIQRSLASIAEAGFYGQIEDDTANTRVSFPAIQTPDHLVKRLVIRHIFNCCRSCSDAINAALQSVDGVNSPTVEPKQTEFTVEGNFDPGAVVEALEQAGFYPQLD